MFDLRVQNEWLLIAKVECNFRVTVCNCGYVPTCQVQDYDTAAIMAPSLRAVVIKLDQFLEINYAFLESPKFTSTYIETQHKVTRKISKSIFGIVHS